MAGTEFLTPIGRLVQGDTHEAQTENMAGQPLLDKKNQPTQRYFIAVAFAKNDPAFPAFWQLAISAARAGFPHLFNAQGQCIHPNFSWKLMDGDGIDNNGKPNNAKEGFAGHWVVKFSSTFPPSCYAAGKYDPAQRLPAGAIKRGYYVRVSGMIAPNTGEKPGLYMNQNMIELAGYGTEIVGGPDAGAIFGGTPLGQLPPGASAAPMSPTPQMGGQPAMQNMPGQYAAPQQPQQAVAPMGMPQMGTPPGMPQMQPQAPQQQHYAPPGMQQQPAPMQAMPGQYAAPQQQPMQPQGVPNMPGAPNMGFVNNAGMVPPMQMQQPAAPVYQMTPAAQGYTREQWNQSGQSDAQLIAAGYMVQVG